MRSNAINHDRLTVDTGTEGGAKQSFKDETNINSIMAKWHRTGAIEHMNKRQGEYGDFSHATDYHDTFLRIQDANLAFDALPSNVRARMHNDPGELMDFLADPENRAEATELGLMDPPPITATSEVANAEAPTAGAGESEAEATPAPEGSPPA